MGSQKLLLSRPAEELPDQPVRPAVQQGRLAGDRNDRRRQAHRHHPRPPGGGRRQDAARRDGRRPRQPGGPQPGRHAAAGDRQPAGPVHAGRGQGLPGGNPPAAARDRRLRLRDAGGQPPLRRQRQRPCPAARRRRRRHAHRRGEKSQQLPGGRAGHAVRGGAAVRGVPPRRPAAGARREGDGRLGRGPRRHRGAAPQGGGGRLPLLPGAGPRPDRGR